MTYLSRICIDRNFNKEACCNAPSNAEATGQKSADSGHQLCLARLTCVISSTMQVCKGTAASAFAAQVLGLAYRAPDGIAHVMRQQLHAYMLQALTRQQQRHSCTSAHEASRTPMLWAKESGDCHAHELIT